MGLFLRACLVALALGKDATVSRLTADLGSENHQRRERATQALRALGPLAVPQLRPAAASSDAEVRRRAGLLLRAARARLLERAAERVVLFEEAGAGKGDNWAGTLLRSDGKTAYVLTFGGLLSRPEGVEWLAKGDRVRWGGRARPAKLVKADYLDEGGCWALVSFPCDRVLEPIRLADRCAPGCWYAGLVNPDTPFREDFDVLGEGLIKKGCPYGGCFFALDEATYELRLAGGPPWNEVVAWMPYKSFIRVPGPDKIRAFLKGTKADPDRR